MGREAEGEGYTVVGEGTDMMEWEKGEDGGGRWIDAQLVTIKSEKR